MVNNKGSVLIFVVIIINFVLILSLSTFSLTKGEDHISRSFESSLSAYYIAEAGIERAVSLIKRDLTPLMEKEIYTLKDKGNTYIASLIESGITHEDRIKEMTKNYLNMNKVLDKLISKYFRECFSDDIINYEISDRRMFRELDGSKDIYYKICKAEPDPYNKRRIKIICEGCSGTSKESIDACFLIDISEVMDFKHGEHGHPELYISADNLFDLSNQKWKEY